MAVDVVGSATTVACFVKAAFKGETAHPDLTKVMLVPPWIADGLAKKITACSRQAKCVQSTDGKLR